MHENHLPVANQVEASGLDQRLNKSKTVQVKEREYINDQQ